MDWGEEICGELDRRIDALQKVSCRDNTKLFQNSVVKLNLTEVHNKNILVPVDKTSVAIIIRRLYAFTLIKEF